MSLEKPLNELKCNLITETLETIDEIYRKDPVSKKKWKKEVINTSLIKFKISLCKV